MLRLVRPSLDGEPVRCRVPSRTLGDDPARERIVCLLVRARLVTAEEDTVELAHEALARAWPRLRSWLDDDAAGQRILRHLAAAADGWESLGRPDSELYRGARLETALECRDAPVRPDHGRNRASSSLDGRAEPSPHARPASPPRRPPEPPAPGAARGGRRAVGRCARRRAARPGAGAAMPATARHARAAEADAELESLVNRSLALRATDRDVAALLAVEAARRWPDDPRATSALLGTFTAAGGFLGYHYVPTPPTRRRRAFPGPDGTLGSTHAARCVDLETGEMEERFRRPVEGGTAR